MVIASLEEHVRLLMQLGKERLLDGETHGQAIQRTQHALVLMKR